MCIMRAIDKGMEMSVFGVCVCAAAIVAVAVMVVVIVGVAAFVTPGYTAFGAFPANESSLQSEPIFIQSAHQLCSVQRL